MPGLRACCGLATSIVLSGPLGAEQRRRWCRASALGSSVEGRIASPTFVIARVHPGALPLVHVDAYRLGSLAEVDDLDLGVDAADVVTAVEWGAGLVEQLAEARLEVVIDRGLRHRRANRDAGSARRRRLGRSGSTALD